MTSQTLQTIFQVVIAVGVLFTAIGGLGAYFFGQRAQREKEVVIEKKEKETAAKKAYSGVLESKNELLFAPMKKIYPQFEFGDSGSILKFTGKQGSPLFKIAGDNNIIIEVEGGQVKISTAIRNNKGHVVAEITKNEWKVNPDKSWDRNYSKLALEVKDPTGDIILQVKLVEDRVQFQAKLYDITGGRIGFGKMKGPEGWGGVIEFTGQNQRELALRIQPIFKYPSELRLGELVR